MVSEDGLEEMVDDFNGGKILYGGLRILDPNSKLPKVVFINWVSFQFNLQTECFMILCMSIRLFPFHPYH